MKYNWNYVSLSDDIKRKIEKFIRNIYSYIENEYNQEVLNPIYYRDVILLISEGFPILKDKEKWEKIGYDICKAIKQDLENYGVMENDIGMIESFGYTCFVVSQYSKKTGNLTMFSNGLNKLFLDFLVDKAEVFKADSKVTMRRYDVISGLSGSLYYLLDFSWNEDEIKKIGGVISYLVSLTKLYNYKGNSVMKFHITRDNQFRDDEKERFTNGNFNFGISHGIMGPLVALSKAFSLGYKVDGLKESIVELAELYERFKVYKDNISLWPSQLSFEQYLIGKCEEEHCHLASSWCYGNISIARGLQKVSKNMGWAEKEKLYKNDLINIINQPSQNYNLYSPALCHGYSSILAIRTSSYIGDRDYRYIDNIEENINIILRRFEENNKYIEENKEVLKNKDNYIEGYIEDLSLLSGSLGIALVLLSVILEDIGYSKLLLID
ncbi:lanthionine synthetase LanC family protein [Tissierella sp. MB52-C2]|uniref:lanthionine synthetase LanC family protein n=1 Tax=Tissierella sp. MB52-C2 TaxID=3070999 RepID=UPI00280A6006|nr:lanthionine synthetase LanC family protein [Tissierella sp. MB52-C2]WMM25772.1 lanthionine synthetase LanC family protein [Tissierella sp. MB52-C2]